MWKLEMWSYDRSESSKKIKLIVDGRELKIRESMVYMIEGTYIVEFLWKMKVPSLVNPHPRYNDRHHESYQESYTNITLEQLKDLYGVYRIYLDTEYEGYVFIWYMKRNSIISMYTATEICIQKFDRKEYLDFLSKFNTESLEWQAENYHLLFNLPYEATKEMREKILEYRCPATIKELKYKKIY